MQVDAETNRNDAPQSATYFILSASWLSRHIPEAVNSLLELGIQMASPVSHPSR